MIATGETPESVRVGDLRSLWRSEGFEAGTKRNISEFFRKEMPWAEQMEFFSEERLADGFLRRNAAASFAAFSLFSESSSSRPFFLGANLGILPSVFCISAAAYALLAEIFSPGNGSTYWNRLESSPTAK